jgi:hypothetical protein
MLPARKTLLSKPNFFILGAQRAGTTWLAVTLRQHPQTFLPSQKELHFFSHARNYAKGTDWYLAHFSRAGSARAIGEATPNYLGLTHRPDAAATPKRIYDLVPDARFIVSLRDPASRAISCVLHLMRIGYESPWIDPDRRIQEILKGGPDPSGVLAFGQYATQIEQYLAVFPRERFCFLHYERDLAADRAATFARVCDFLGIDSGFSPPALARQANAGLSTRPGLLLARLPPREITASLGRSLERTGLFRRLSVSPETGRALARHYEPEVKRLSELLSWDLSDWREEAVTRRLFAHHRGSKHERQPE